MECRKQKASEWKIRLTEEFRANQKAEFVTLTFSPESIERLEKEIHEKKYRGIQGEETDVNILAAYAVRMFTERWRKKWKKAPHHWLITELGHKNSERIHLHGLIWQTHENCTKEEFQSSIIDKWAYGTVYIGEWVDERTINYITKYITKTDLDHDGYKNRTLVSKGIGKNYLLTGAIVNKFAREETNTNYTTNNGRRLKMPRYYAQKLWTTEQREMLWIYQMNKEEVWLATQKWDTSRSDEMDVREKWKKVLDKAREINIAVKYTDNKQVQYKYIVTPAMKLNYNDLNILRDKQEKRIKARELEKTIPNEEVEKLNKGWGVEKQILGQYIGATTKGQRKYNEEMATAKEMNINVRTLRLIRKGIITNIN